VWEVVESFEEHVHQFTAADGISHFLHQHFEVADVLIDVWEVEGKMVKACLSNLLLR